MQSEAMAKQRRQTLLLEAQSLLASGGFGTAEAGVRQSVRATAALAARGQWEGGGDNAPAAQLTPAKATPSPPPASTVPPADDPAAKLALRLQWQQENEERGRKLAESNAAAAEAKDHDAQASNAKAAAELEYECKIAKELAEQKAKEAAEHAEQTAREAEAEQVLADAEQNAAKQLAEQQAAAKEREQQQENAKPNTHSNAGASGLCKRRVVKVEFLNGDEPLTAPTAASEERERERERSPAFMRECGQSTGAQDHKQAESTATGSTP